MLPALRLHELFQCDASDLVRRFGLLARNKYALRSRSAPAPGRREVTRGCYRVPPPPGAGGAGGAALRLQPDPLRRRLRASVDLELALQLFNVRRDDAPDEEARVRLCGEELRRALDALNASAAAEVHEHLRCALDNCLEGMRYAPRAFDVTAASRHRPPLTVTHRPFLRRYFRLQADGPKIAEVSTRHPLVPR